MFDTKKVKNELIEWIREYFKNNGSEETKAIIRSFPNEKTHSFRGGMIVKVTCWIAKSYKLEGVWLAHQE